MKLWNKSTFKFVLMRLINKNMKINHFQVFLHMIFKKELKKRAGNIQYF